ncbi:MAG: hypothetical protein IKN74_05340 [Clostridia bacterium]|nr:hypothetical protein [Clostridia bacterium]
MFKKFITKLFICILLFNFIFLNSAYVPPSFAREDSEPTKEQRTYAENKVEGVEGNTIFASAVGGEGDNNSYGGVVTTVLASILGIVTLLFDLIVFQVDIAAGVLSNTTEDIASEGGGSSEKLNFFLTIERIVFNRIPIFNANYFDTEDEYKVGEITLTSSKLVNAIKENVATVYGFTRILAIAVALLMLIYIGIRMAMSTISADQAKYKKMFISWVESIVVLFLLTYIMVAIITFGEILTGIFSDLNNQVSKMVDETGAEVTYKVEEELRLDVIRVGLKSLGVTLVAYSIIYLALLFMILKFGWLYLKRFFSIGFLIVIAPLITITYSMDKAGDGKAQAFSTWTREFLVNVLIQPLHALIYLVFIASCAQIARVAPFLFLFFLLSLGKAEQMVMQVFDLKKGFELGGLDKFFGGKK